MVDNVNHPAHYTQFEHEVIELTRHLPFDAGNFIKYVLRSPFKGNKIEDLQKALWYAEDFAEHLKLKEVRTVSKKKYAKIFSKWKYFEGVIQGLDIPCAKEFADLAAAIVQTSVRRRGEDYQYNLGKKSQPKRMQAFLKNTMYGNIEYIEDTLNKA